MERSRGESGHRDLPNASPPILFGNIYFSRNDMDVPNSDLERISKQISSDTSPVGIDARKTHIVIIHMLEQIDRRLSALEARLDSFDSPRH